MHPAIGAGVAGSNHITST